MVRHEGVEDLLEYVGQWCKQHAQADGLQQAEQLGLEVGRQVGRLVAEEAIRASVERSEQTGGSIQCDCGGRARMVNRRGRTLLTLCGPVPVKRRYYHCGQCGRGYLPWDAAQGLNRRHYTPALKALVAGLAAQLSYAETVQVIEQTTGLQIEESGAELIVEEVGRRAREAEAQQIERALAGEVDLEQEPPELVYVGIDGAQAHIDASWHEVKNGVVYDEEGQKRYVAAQEPAEQFGDRVYAAAAQAGVQEARQTVVIGDGAEWIWNLSAMHFPDAIEIVDYWHACEHIWEVANAHYGEGTRQARRWADRHKRRLLQEGPGPLLRALDRMKPNDEEAAEAIRLARGYFRSHRHRMRYPQFRRMGLAIGSGPVEAACKVIVGQRLKRAGMRWSHDGADHILALRCLVKNGEHHKLQHLARAA